MWSFVILPTVWTAWHNNNNNNNNSINENKSMLVYLRANLTAPMSITKLARTQKNQ
jgi:hypothetical protein